MQTHRYVLVVFGMHLIELIKYNPIEIEAVFDCCPEGALKKTGVSELTNNIIPVQREASTPFVSVFENRRFYKQLEQLLHRYRGCRFIITGTYAPIWRFIIDRVGSDNIELWEDGLNHYIEMEKILPKYKFKEFFKLLAGHYPIGVFNSQYRKNELFIRDRYIHGNLVYRKPVLPNGEVYFIGQPLVEDRLVSESRYRQVLTERFAGKNVCYLPHPREQSRAWLNDIANITPISCSAEQHLKLKGASAVFSAFSTVNANVTVDTNQWWAGDFGLSKIVSSLKQYDFGVDII